MFETSIPNANRANYGNVNIEQNRFGFKLANFDFRTVVRTTKYARFYPNLLLKIGIGLKKKVLLTPRLRTPLQYDSKQHCV